MPSFDRKNPCQVTRADRDALTIKLSEKTIVAVDAWAQSHQMTRSDAIRQLIELGLSALPHRPRAGPNRLDPVAHEYIAARQLSELLDPSLPPAERERRIRRLIEGPPEFSDQRIDLPKHGT